LVFLKALLAAALCVTLILSNQAFAHVTVEEASIEDGASLSEAPKDFSFSFGGDVRLVGLTLSGAGLDDEDLTFSPEGGFAAD
jgi:methionine-rich copper-binding protein CopC